MGAKCVGGHYIGSNKSASQFHDSLPGDIDSYHPDKVRQKLPKLSFEGSISNIKIINCPQEHYFSLKIKIEDVIEIDLPKRKVQPITEFKRQSGEQILYMQNQLKWLSREKLSFMMDEFQLRTHFLSVYVYDENKSVQSNIRVNLYAIVTGPYRHDFYVRLKSHAARLLFELDLSEKIEAKLQPLEIKVELDKSYSGEEFNFSLKQLTHRQVISTSKVSTSEKTFSLNTSMQSPCRYLSPDRRETSSTDSPKLRRKRDKNSPIHKRPKSSLNWISYGQQSMDDISTQRDIQIKTMQMQLKKRRLPSLKVYILSNEIMKSNIQLNLWVEKKKQFADLPLKNIEKDAVVFGLAQVSLNKIFDEHYEEIEANLTSSQTCVDSTAPNFNLQIREFTRQDRLLSKDGQVLGKCWLRFRMTNPKFFRQLNYCAKTEDGIINMITAFKNYSGKSSYLKNPVIKDILKHSQTIQSLAKKLSILETAIWTKGRQIKEIQNQIECEFQTMNRQLVNSCSSSYVLSSSNLEIQLLQAQDALIQVLQQLYVFLVYKNGLFTDVCWQVAVNIYKRGQFYLQNLGFKDFDNKKLIQAKSIKQKKISVALRFKCTIYKFLILVLQQQQPRRITNRVSWSQCFKAFAYFRVPLFRMQVLSAIQRNEDQQLIEWKIPDFDEVSVYSAKFRTEYQNSTNHLDWKHYFYGFLEGRQEARKLDKQLSDVLESNQWVRKLGKRENDFYLFVGYLVRILQQIWRTLKVLKWKYFPGYTKIVRSFLVEMKKLQLFSYSQTLISSSIQLLVNQQLINILMPLVIQKTDINNHNSLTKGMCLLCTYLNTVTSNGTKMLPQIFNYLYFYKILKLVLQTENIIALITGLAMIEKFFTCFNQQFKENLSLYLMGKVFFKLFLHWSHTVRLLFHTILISHINYHLILHLEQKQTDSNKKENFQAHHQIEERYLKVQQLIYSSEQVKKAQQNEKLYDHCFKQLHKKMKKKLSLKKATQSKLNQDKQQDQPIIIYKTSQYSMQNLLKSNYCPQETQKYPSYYINFTQKKNTINPIHLTEIQDDSKDSQEAVVFHGESFNQENVRIEKSLQKFDSELQRQLDQGDSQFQTEERKKSSNTLMPEKTFGIRKYSQNHISPERYKNTKTPIPQSPSLRRRKAKYTYFGHQDNQLRQISDTQIRHILASMQQYKMQRDKIQKYVQENRRVPEFDLNAEINKDQETQFDSLKLKTDVLQM